MEDEEDIPQTPLSPTGSLRGWRPSLVWLFNHIRADDRDYLTKEDLVNILGGTIDSAELDEAFEKLDTDGDGRIKIDEFMGGFATFLRDAHHSPMHGPDMAMRQRSGSFRRKRRPIQELFYESGSSVEEGATPPPGFKQSLSFISPQNRYDPQYVTCQYSQAILYSDRRGLERRSERAGGRERERNKGWWV